jgi:hypothetical protein
MDSIYRYRGLSNCNISIFQEFIGWSVKLITYLGLLPMLCLQIRLHFPYYLHAVVIQGHFSLLS